MVGDEKITSSVILNPTGLRQPWECASYEDLSESHFERLSLLQADFILFGSGARLRFPKPEWLKSLYSKHIGIETMDTAAACRTFNFLAAEGRNVIAALLL